MNDFNLQKFLIENKMTRNSRLLNENENSYNSFFQSYLNQELSNNSQNPGSIEIIKRFKNRNISSLDELAINIAEVEDVLTDEVGAYPGEFYNELRERLEELCDEENFPQKEELLAMLDMNYLDT